MIQGVRKPQEAQALGLSRRLLTRLGALLKRQIAVTGTILESARPGSSLENLLLDPLLLDLSGPLSTATLTELATRHGFAAPSGSLLTQPAPDGFQVICLQEELDAAEGWGSEDQASPGGAPLPAPCQPPAPPAPSSQAGTPAPLPALALRPGGEAAEALFTSHELARLKIKAITAAHQEERIEALRILTHSPLAERERAELLFEALNDREQAVRGEAASLLTLLGLAPQTAEDLRELSAPAPAARQRAAERLRRRQETGLGELDRGATAVCAQAALRSEDQYAVAAALLELLTGSAAMAQGTERNAELVRLLLAQLLRFEGPAGPREPGNLVYSGAQNLLRALLAGAPEPTVALLLTQLEQASDPLLRSFLLQNLLEAPTLDPAQKEQALAAAASFLAQDTQEGRESRAVGMTLVQRGQAAIRPLARQFPSATVAAQRYFLRLFDEILRFQSVGAEEKECAAAALLQALEAGTRSLRIAALMCRYGGDPQLGEEIRARLAEAFLGSIPDLGFQSDIEIAEDHVARIGLPALKALRDRLDPERPAAVRAQAARILGNLGLKLRPAPGTLRKAMEQLTDLLRKLEELSSDPRFPDRGTLLVALGKLAASPAASPEAEEVVSRHLLQASSQEPAPAVYGALEGLSWLAASRRAHPQFVATVLGTLRRTLDELRPELAAQTVQAEGSKVIEIESADDLMDRLPVVLKGICRIACSTSCPPAFRKEIAQDLAGRWRKIVAGEIVWGPANAMLVVETLREIGCHKDLPHPVRMEILNALALRLVQPPVMRALTTILAESDEARTAPAALTVGQAILNRRGPDGKFEREDHPDILRAVAQVAGRRHLGTAEAPAQEKALRFRRTVVEELLRAAKDQLPGSLDLLARIGEARVLPEADQQALERRLSEFTALRTPIPSRGDSCLRPSDR